jgi:hypothetical protein
MIKDTKFWLTTFLEKQEQTKHEYRSFKREIENNGCFIVKVDTDTVKIYTPELAVILTSKELPAQNMDIKKETTINGWDYLKTYIEAYKEGEHYFETEHKASPNTLYGVNAEQYVRDIHLNFFHVKHTGINEGWGYVKKQYPFILTHKAVKEFGYYSGIVNKVEEQVNKYPRLFAKFDKCEHNLPSQQTKFDKIKAPVLGLFCNLINRIGIDKKEETESATVYCKRICDKFQLTYTDRVRQNYNVNETKKLIQELTEKVFPLIDNVTKDKIEKYLDSKQPPKQNLYA